MNIKTITNQSSLTIIIIAIMLLISGALENAKAQTYRDRDNDGLIEISNIEQLDSIRYNRTGICSSTCSGYELTRSLDFKSTSSYRDTTGKLSAFTKGSGWDPIGSCTYHCVYGDEFNTTFEGNGYTIDNLYINRPSNSDVGLFGYTKNNSRIRNIGLRNVSISGSRLVGGLVGQNYGYITQSYATGSVSGNSYYVGGLVGNNFGKIMQSYFTGVVSGESVVGGLVGINSIDITQSYATGSVSGNSTFVGGLVGYNSTSGTITQSSSTESASGSSSVAGLVGNNLERLCKAILLALLIIFKNWDLVFYIDKDSSPQSIRVQESL